MSETMSGRLYPYDRVLYSRSFLNCYQRQSLVMLAERVPDLHRVFYRCLISTDDILEQIVRRQSPKYDFQSMFFGAEDLRKIGVAHQELPFDHYSEGLPVVLDAIQQKGFALLVVDVFYLPHCPEHRKQHIVHTIVLTGYDADAGEWSLIDDNPASVLCCYTYPEQMIAEAYDNNILRRVRIFSSSNVAESQLPGGHRKDFVELVEKHHDTGTLLAHVDEILDCPWIARESAIARLHDAFSLYQGSRTCLLEYLKKEIDDAETESTTRWLVKKATEIQNALLVGKVMGSVDLRWIKHTCAELWDGEMNMVTRLKTASGH